jgi:anti-anti-sigma factor
MDEKKGVEIETKGNAGIVSFQTSSISDVDEINAISEKIADFIDKNQPNRLIFDFKQVKFFSSQVLGILINLRSKLSSNKGEVLICGINPQLHRVFKITNLDKIFRFFPDIERAINATGATNEV